MVSTQYEEHLGDKPNSIMHRGCKKNIDPIFTLLHTDLPQIFNINPFQSSPFGTKRLPKIILVTCDGQ